MLYSRVSDGSLSCNGLHDFNGDQLFVVLGEGEDYSMEALGLHLSQCRNVRYGANVPQAV